MRSARRLLAALATALAVAAGMLAPTPAEAAEGDLPVPYTFLTSAVLGGIMLDADPPGANDFGCRPSRRHPRPVVLVHGLIGNKNTNWQTYAPLLKNHGYCVFALTYGVPEGTPTGADQFGGLQRMEDSAAELKAFVAKVLRRTGARKVDLLGHSEGTLMPNYYVRFLGGAKHVKRYVSIAPLWHGTVIASIATTLTSLFDIPDDELPLCAACAQFSPTSRFMKKMRKGGPAVEGVEYTNVVTQYDQLVVPYTSGIQRGMRNHVLQEQCHLDLSEHFQVVASPVVARLVLNTLDPRHQQPVPCRVVLPFVGLPG